MKKIGLWLIPVIGLFFIIGIFSFFKISPQESVGAEYSYEEANELIDAQLCIEEGGQVYLAKGSAMTLSEGTISSGLAYKGGAIYISNGATFTMTGGVITANTAVYGGAIYVEAGGTLNLSGGTISSNTAQFGSEISGATNYAIYAEDINDVTISDSFIFDTNEYVRYIEPQLAVYTLDENNYETLVEEKFLDKEVTTYTIAEDDMPISYENCCGYYLNTDLTDSVLDVELSVRFNNTKKLYTKNATLTYLAFTLSNSTYLVRSTSSSISGEVVIPLEYNDVYVTGTRTASSYSSGAFYNRTAVTSIVYSNKFITLNAYSFYKCTGLTKTPLLNNITTLGNYSFYSCSGLTNVDIPTGITSIGSYAFYGCTGLAEINIPDNVKTVNTMAFSGCTGVITLTIGTGVTTLGTYAFRGCTALTEINYNAKTVTDLSSSNCLFYDAGKNGAGITVNFGSEVTKVPAYLFCPYGSSYVPNIITVNFAEDSVCTSIGNCSFYGCKALSQINLPDSVLTIGNSAFNNCSAITEVDIPDLVTTIGTRAFSGCSNLESLTIGKEVKTIGELAFYYDRKMSSIYYKATMMNDLPEPESISMFSYCGMTNDGLVLTIANNVTRIPANLFMSAGTYGGDCYIKEIIFEEDSKCGSIGKSAFSGVRNLTSISFPNSVTSIGETAFYQCYMLASVSLHENVESVGAGAFANSSLEEIVLEESNPYFMIYDTSLYTIDGLTLVATTKYSSTILDSVTTIFAYSFYYGYGATDVTIPSGVTELEDYTFYSCTNLVNINLPNGLTNVGHSCFDSASLESLTLPSSLVSVGAYAFHYCSQFSRDITLSALILPDGLTTIGEYAFSSCLFPSVYIPSSVTSIGVGAFTHGYNLEEITISANNANYMVSDNALYDKSGTELIVACDTTTEILSTTEIIHDQAFYNTAITSMTIPDGVTTIGEKAFSYCYGLLDVVLPSSIISIGESAFEYCEKLVSVTIPESVSEIGIQAFAYCYMLSEINYNAVNIPDGSGDNVFREAGKNGSGIVMMIGASVERIPGWLFGYNNSTDAPKVTKLQFEENSACTSIGPRAFWYFTSLTSAYIPSSVDSIGYDAFSGCSNLTLDVWFTSTEASSMCGSNWNSGVKATNYGVTSASSFTAVNAPAIESWKVEMVKDEVGEIDYSLGEIILNDKDELEYDISNFRIA